MYRCCKCKKCFALNNNMANFNEDAMETKCSNIANDAVMCNSIDNCMCGFDEEENVFPENPMLAQSYVPWQTMNQTFTPCVGLKMGTIYPELVSPYTPCDSMRQIQYIEDMNRIGEGCNR